MTKDSDLGLHQSVDDGLQGLVPIAGQHPFKVLRAVLQGFGDCHIQVVVRLLCCQVLCLHIILRKDSHIKIVNHIIL